MPARRPLTCPREFSGLGTPALAAPRHASPNGAGHSVEVLLRVCAKCLDDGEDIAKTRIDAALRDS